MKTTITESENDLVPSAGRIFLVLLLFGLLIRLVAINLPLLDTRQAHNAFNARNFYRNGYQFLYPEIDCDGPGPSYLVNDFPLLQFTTAILYGVSGGVHENLGRLMSVASWVGTAAILYLLARKYYGEKTALFAVAFFTLSPLSIAVSRSFQHDFLMLFFLVVAIYAFSEWMDRDAWSWFLIALVSATLSVLIKATALHMGLPFLFLAYRKYGRRLFLRPILWLFTGVIVGSLALWGYHAQTSATADHMKQLSSLSYWFDPSLFLDHRFYIKVFQTEVGWALTPLGFALLLLGLVLKIDDRRELLFYSWLGGVGIMFIVFNQKVYHNHYYHLSVLPVASIFIGKGLTNLSHVGLLERTVLERRVFQPVAVIVILGIVISYAFPTYIVPRMLRYEVPAAKAVQKVSDPDDLILVASILGGGGPHIIYNSDRHGWALDLEGQSSPEAIKELESRRQQGAAYFVVVYMPEFTGQPDFAEYMYHNYSIVGSTSGLSQSALTEVKDGGGYLIFDLRERLSEANTKVDD